jgi:5-(carboxyamino)imidazole ribonucleotide mutase
VESRTLKGLDSLLSIVQMPAGVPVATVAIGGGRNAGLLAVRMLACTDASLRAKVRAFMRDLAGESRTRGRKLARELQGAGAG